nr:RNA-directed DNA polymerase, eukaryota, nucleotide-binding alpha-beta plait domain protein [Tanacetum cinerariifolium]
MEKARSNRYMSDLDTSKISFQSKFDQTSKISKSVFISNFPDDCTSRDLWKVCNDYGTVVDVFIPNKKSKAGKRFAFVRFIKYHGGSNMTISTPPFLLKPTLVLDDSCLVNRDLVSVQIR